MLLNDNEFPSSTTYFDKHAELRAIAGSNSRFTQFRPVRFPCILFLFLRQRLCFFFTGPFVLYVGGFVHSFEAFSFYIILNECHPTIRKIFQKDENLIPHFQLGSFKFELFHAMDDCCTYHVRCGDFKISILRCRCGFALL